MSVSFPVPASPSKSILTIDEFQGVDFTNSPANVDERKSPDSFNMIRDVPGKVRKRMGYKTIKTYDGKINGAHFRRGANETLIHAGTKIYKDYEASYFSFCKLVFSEIKFSSDDVLYSEANDERSRSWQFKDKLYIIDGKALLEYDGEKIQPVSAVAYIPTLTISKEPSGGGTAFEDLNLLQPGFIETFYSDGESKEYSLSFKELDETPVKVEILDSNGDWIEKKENTDFTVNRETGVINFTTAPGKSPVEGEDNVKITAYRTVEGYADRINKCTVGTLFGVNGALDRLFLSGNSEYINYDWYSNLYDPTYFADTAYSVLGSDSSSIIGYSIISNYLAAHKDERERDQSVILRAGDLQDDQPSFRIVNTLQGPGAIAKDTFAYLATEPVFLTRLGVYAVTAQDITGEKYAQNRSFFLNGKLLNEENLEKAFAFVWQDMYWLCVNNVCYILDGLQPLMTDKSMPYATRQYAGFYCVNIPATTMWEQDGKLNFGTADGKLCQFYTNKDDNLSYNDDGKEIDCRWETPDIDGKLFYKNKTFRHMSVRLGAALATSLRISVQKRGVWSEIKYDDYSARYLSFANIIFSKFTFSSDDTPRVIPTKLRVKKVDKARFRLENNVLNEPFTLYNISLEYVENGNFKG